MALPLCKSSAGEQFGSRRISKQGRSHARWLLIEAATAAVRVPGPLQGFYLRLRAKKCHNKAIVATARKMVHFIWHMLTTGEPYRYAAPVQTHEKARKLELLAGGERQRARKTNSTDAPADGMTYRQRRKHDHDLAPIAQAQYEELVRLRARVGAEA